MLNLSWLDYLLLLIFFIYAYQGYAAGFIYALLDSAKFVFSFLVGLRFYGLAAKILMDKFSLSQGFSDAIGFFVIVFIAEITVGILIKTLVSLIGGFSLQAGPGLKILNRISGIIPGIFSGLVLVAFVLVLAITMPVSVPIKRVISSSRIGSFLISNTQGWEKQINSVFGGAIDETINFLTVEPKGNEIVSLNFSVKNVSPDPASERYMYELVNEERVSRGIRQLAFDTKLRGVGRGHCRDMLVRGYFSHYTPEGFSPFVRMDEAGIIYAVAGENLALSPNTDIAMQGLMNSPGHKANILSPDFGRVGIGVIDGGIYGEMFCQEFAD